MSAGGDVTAVLRAMCNGDGDAMQRLLPMVYAHMHSAAEQLMRRERRDHTLQATALVNEAYLKLVDQRNARYEDRLHFYHIAAMIMRRILADHAIASRRLKRGGGLETLSLEEAEGRVCPRGEVDVAAFDEALRELEAVNEELARVVEMRYFGGMSEEQIAHVLGVTVRAVERRGRAARARLLARLDGGMP